MPCLKFNMTRTQQNIDQNLFIFCSSYQIMHYLAMKNWRVKRSYTCLNVLQTYIIFMFLFIYWHYIDDRFPKQNNRKYKFWLTYMMMWLSVCSTIFVDFCIEWAWTWTLFWLWISSFFPKNDDAVRDSKKYKEECVQNHN